VSICIFPIMMNDEDKFWFIEQRGFMDRLSQVAKSALKDKTICKQAEKHKIIYFPEDISDQFFILRKGKVKIFTESSDGKEMILAILGPGEIFGELALVGQEKREHYAEAMEDTVICSMKAHEIKDWLSANPEINLQITKIIGEKLKKVQSRLKSLVFQSAPDRIKDFIREQVDEHGRDVGYEKEVKLSLTHQDIANLTATSRQTVTTVLSDLEKKEIILYDRKRILVRDYAALKAS